MNASIQHAPDTIAAFTIEFDARVRAQILAVAAGLLCEHQATTLGDLIALPGAGGEVLLSLTLCELLNAAELASVREGTKLRGRDFDELVLRVLTDHEQRMADDGVRFTLGMSRSDLIARVGGPRWKLQASMRRLEGAGKVVRSGITSATRYTIARASTV